MTTNRGFSEQPYTRVLIPLEEGGYFGEILEFPGCITEGETPEETLRNLNEAAEGWIEAALEQGQSIPEPSTSRGFNGRIALRLPRSLHRRAAVFAEREGISLNQYIVASVSMMVGSDDMVSHFTDRLNIAVTSATRIQATVSDLVYRWPPHFGVVVTGEAAARSPFLPNRAGNLELAHHG